MMERYAIDPQKAVQRIQVRTKAGKIKEGLAGITYVSLFLPLLWVFLPFMALSFGSAWGKSCMIGLPKTAFCFLCRGTARCRNMTNPEKIVRRLSNDNLCRHNEINRLDL